MFGMFETICMGWRTADISDVVHCSSKFIYLLEEFLPAPKGAGCKTQHLSTSRCGIVLRAFPMRFLLNG